MQWTCTQYDRMGRVVAAAMFKGSVAPSDCESTTNRTGITRTEYYADASGVWAVVTDPAGKKRKTRQDALGRLMEVVEDPGKCLANSFTVGNSRTISLPYALKE
jgi:hypothetical protein